MLVPKITFNESNIGVSPIRTGIRNRIGIVGEFSRGSANVFNYINGFSDFASLYGSDTTKGSLAFQAAYDQGARDFGIVRVLGHGHVAHGNVLFNGISSKPNRLIFYLKYIGSATAKFNTLLSDPIFTTGSYSGTVNGRYHFYVSDVTSNLATVKFKFISISEAPSINQSVNINWSNVSDSFTVDLINDKGVALTNPALNGVTLKFGTSTQTNTLTLKVGYEWLVRVNSFSYITDIFKDALPNQVTSAFVSSTQGLAPLGTVIANASNNGASFYLDDSDDSFIGKIGEGHSYYFELEEPDAIVKCTASIDANAPTQIIASGPIPSYIKVGATVTSTYSGLVVSGTRVQSLSSSTNQFTNQLETTITLDTPLISPSDSTRSFTFENPNGLSVSPYLESSLQFFQGGVESPRNASLDLFSLSGTPLIRLYAVSPGSWGNNLRVTVYPITQSQFRLIVNDLTAEKYNPPINTEDYIIDLASDNSISSDGSLSALNNSNLIRGVLLPFVANPNGFDANYLNTSPQRLAPPDSSISDPKDKRHVDYYGPTKLTSISLEEGYDGPPVTEDDYIRALNQLREAPVHIILAAGIYEYPRVKSHLITIAEGASELEGLRIAILNARPNLNPLASKQETIGLESKRAVMVNGWSTYAGQPNSPRFGLAPDALYAGKLATIPYYVSPSARTSAGSIIGITEIDTQRYNSLNSLQVYIDARLETLTLDPALEAFFFTSGRTLSSSGAWDRVSIRRTYDIVRMDLFLNLQQYKSEPHTRLLRKQITSSINAYFGVMARNGRIANFKPAICDETNNPSDSYTSGRLDIQVSFLPLFAADYLDVTFIRDSLGGLQVGE